MAEGYKKISELAAASALSGTEVIPLVQSGETKSATPNQLGGDGAQSYVLIAEGEFDLGIEALNTIPFASGMSLANTSPTDVIVKLTEEDNWDFNAGSMLEIDNADGVTRDAIFGNFNTQGAPIQSGFGGLIYGANSFVSPLLNGTNNGIFNNSEDGNYYYNVTTPTEESFRVKISIYGIKTA